VSPDLLVSLDFIGDRVNVTFPCPVYSNVSKRLLIAQNRIPDNCLVVSPVTQDSLRFLPRFAGVPRGCSLRLTVEEKDELAWNPGWSESQSSVVYLPRDLEFLNSIVGFPLRVFTEYRIGQASKLLRDFYPSSTDVSPRVRFGYPLSTDDTRSQIRLEFLGDAVISLVVHLTSD